MDTFGIDSASARDVEPRHLHTEVMFAAVGHREIVSASMFQAANDHGIGLRQSEPTSSLRELNRLLSCRPISFIVGASAPDGMSLVDCTAITAVHFPPLVLFHEGCMDECLAEKMRRAGVTAILPRNASPEVFAGVAARLARSWGWVRVPLGRVDVPSAIQRVSGLGDELCLTVACPHVKPVTHEPWRALTPCQHGHHCGGWFGRIYLRDGNIVAAETPTETGIAALATMMQMHEGQLVCHEVFLRPAADNVGLPICAALLHAAAFCDHRNAGIEVA